MRVMEGARYGIKGARSKRTPSFRLKGGTTSNTFRSPFFNYAPDRVCGRTPIMAQGQSLQEYSATFDVQMQRYGFCPGGAAGELTRSAHGRVSYAIAA